MDSNFLDKYTQNSHEIDYEIFGEEIQFVEIELDHFGGEDLFLAILEGPDIIYIQSLPFSRLARKIIALAPQNNEKKQRRRKCVRKLRDYFKRRYSLKESQRFKKKFEALTNLEKTDSNSQQFFYSCFFCLFLL